MKSKTFFLMFIFGILFTMTVCSQISNRSISGEVRRTLTEARIFVPNQALEPTDFTLPYLDGTNFTLSQQKGKVIFLNFWATWCPPCRAEMPSMEALYQRFKDRGLEIIALNLRESNSDVSTFMRQNNLTFPAILDSRGIIGGQYNVRAIPTTYIIDRRGLIVGRLEGAIDWNTPRVIAAFETLLSE